MKGSIKFENEKTVTVSNVETKSEFEKVRFFSKNSSAEFCFFTIQTIQDPVNSLMQN